MDGSAPTQEVLDNDSEDVNNEEEDEIEAWGRLFSISANFDSIDLIDEDYSFGRGEQCSIVFDSPSLMKHPSYSALSKTHFTLYKEDTANGEIVYLQDMSSNGTFINGTKVGKGKKQVLNNNDEIALAMKKNKAFVFMTAETNGSSSEYPDKITEKYTISKELGRGACGVVRLVFSKGSCQRFAMKVIEKKTFSISSRPGNDDKTVQSEVQILKALNHPCIIGIEEVIDTQDALYIILELVEGGELYDRIVSAGELKEDNAKLLFYQMCLAVEYLHKNSITHRDLKPENILLANDDEDTLVKVTDFGLSKFVDATTMLKTFCGTPNYLAPEILQSMGNGAYSSLIDVWSLGVILYVCLVGYPPFTDEREDMSLREQIVGGHFDFPDQFWKDVSGAAKDVVRAMLTVDPAKRPTMAQVLAMDWFQDAAVREKAQRLMDAVKDAEKDTDTDAEKDADAVTSTTTELTATPLVRKRALDSGNEANGANGAKRLQVSAGDGD